ncbi:MAG: hypothetical protein AB7Q97_20785 [Gammaproteobacteria bacterium]
MNARTALQTILAAALLALAGCNTQTVRTMSQAPIRTDLANIPESELLDVGVDVFDPGLDTLGRKELISTPGVRMAEGRFVAWQLVQTLQRTGNWGAVRVVPKRQSETDVYVSGKVLYSDGASLKLAVAVQDATGREWFARTYESVVSKYAYDEDLNASGEPFQDIYNRIANDMLQWRRQMAVADVAEVRAAAQLKFARRFAPEAFAGHLADDGRGRVRVARLPAENDPIMARVERIRERDYEFVDTLQDHYGEFVGRMQGPYRQWRSEAYREAQALKEQRSQAVLQGVLGLAAIGAGIYAQGSDNRAVQTAGIGGIIAGGMLSKDAWDKYSQSKIHAESLKEMAESLNGEIKPHTVALEDRTVTLKGTVDDQYRQWRSVMAEIWSAQTGAPAPALQH